MNKIAGPILESERDNPTPSCAECNHYFITWDTSFPYGCRAMNFKSKRSPHLDVVESSGNPCMMFTLRQRFANGHAD
jgi:hypothetical protein